MASSAFRKMVSCVLLVLFPSVVFAADSNAAMLYSNGPTWVNGSHVPRTSSSIFSGDILQTRSDSVANINEPGSTITVHSESLVQFGLPSVKLEHGGLTISTSRSVGTTVGDVKILPASDAWTEFNVIDVDGTVKIEARKGDLTIDDGNGKGLVTLAQGQETTRDEQSEQTAQKNKKKRQSDGANPAAGGGALNSPIAIGIGGAAIIGVATWVLVQSSNPASPTQP